MARFREKTNAPTENVMIYSGNVAENTPDFCSTNQSTAATSKSRRRETNVYRTAVALNAIICAAAFALSFAALWDLATNMGLPRWITWLFPVLVDGAILQATRSLLHLAGDTTQAGEDDRRFFSRVMAFGAATSIGGNSYHAYLNAPAGFPPAVAAVIAAIAPISLLLASHGLLILNRRQGMNTQNAVWPEETGSAVAGGAAGNASPCDGGRVVAAAGRADADVLELRAEACPGGRLDRDEAQRRVAEAMHEDPHVSIPDLAVGVGWGLSTVYRWAQQIREGQLVPESAAS